MENLLEFKNVKYFYQTKENEINALDGINFSIKEKDFSSIVGPSGCGKTTILSLTAGLLSPSEGEIVLDGKPIQKNDGRIGYMFQRDHLFEWRTIWQNIILGLEIQKKNKDPQKLALAEDLLKKYDLSQTVVDPDYAVELERYGKKIAVHIGIDTGMHRLGTAFCDLEAIEKIFKMTGLYEIMPKIV